MHRSDLEAGESHGLTSNAPSVYLDKASDEVRRDFSVKVFGIVAIQLAVTLLVSALPYIYEPYMSYLESNPG